MTSETKKKVLAAYTAFHDLTKNLREAQSGCMDDHDPSDVAAMMLLIDVAKVIDKSEADSRIHAVAKMAGLQEEKPEEDEES